MPIVIRTIRVEVDFRNHLVKSSYFTHEKVKLRGRNDSHKMTQPICELISLDPGNAGFGFTVLPYGYQNILHWGQCGQSPVSCCMCKCLCVCIQRFWLHFQVSSCFPLRTPFAQGCSTQYAYAYDFLSCLPPSTSSISLWIFYFCGYLRFNLILDYIEPGYWNQLGPCLMCLFCLQSVYNERFHILQVQLLDLSHIIACTLLFTIHLRCPLQLTFQQSDFCHH